MADSIETKVALLIAGQIALKEEHAQATAHSDKVLQKAMDRIAALEEERTKQLKWGVMTLGSFVFLLLSWIANKLFTGNIKW